MLTFIALRRRVFLAISLFGNTTETEVSYKQFLFIVNQPVRTKHCVYEWSLTNVRVVQVEVEQHVTNKRVSRDNARANTASD